jgi:hypothetical protein
MYLSAFSTASHSGEPEAGKDSSTIVAVDRDKNSQQAAKWAVDRLLARGSTLQLVHVRANQSSQNGWYISPSRMLNCICMEKRNWKLEEAFFSYNVIM